MELWEKTLKDLEWNLVKEELIKRSKRKATKESWEKIQLKFDVDSLKREQNCFKEIMDLLKEGVEFFIPEEKELHPLLDIVTKGGILKGEDFLLLKGFINEFIQLYKTVSNYIGRLTSLLDIINQLDYTDVIELKELFSLIATSFNEKGEVEDNASIQLNELKAKERKLREEIYKKLEELMSSYEDILQDKYFTIRHNRYVLPVRTDAHRPLPGIVLDTSQSGATLFIEPQEITKLGNNLSVLRGEIKKEEERILNELSREVEKNVTLLKKAIAISDTLDYYLSGAKLGIDMKGVFPEILPPGNKLTLKGAKHILLALKGEAIPNDIELEQGRVVVVSGPNGGGKTVTLKTVGLCQIMYQLGLPLPIEEGSKLPLMKSIYTDIGEEGGLSQNLSTFSAHMKFIKIIIESVAGDSLVLLDELAGGTDPEEGGALAIAILNYLANSKPYIMVTTHYEPLKIIATQKNKEFRNASLGIDPYTMKPNFKLEYDLPGLSSPLNVAKSYGLPEEIIEYAKNLLKDDRSKLKEVLIELEHKKGELQKYIDEYRTKLDSLEKKEKALNDEIERIKRREVSMITSEARRIEAKLREIKQKIKEIENEIKQKEKLPIAHIQKLSQTVSKLEEDFAPGGEIDQFINQGRIPAGKEIIRTAQLKPGDTVYYKLMKQEGKVVEVTPNKIVLIINNIKVTVNPKDCIILSEDKRKGGEKKAPHKFLTPSTLNTTDTIDLRGERVEDALKKLEKFIDNAILNGVERIYIKHGHGSGALKKAIREFLKTNPYIEKSEKGDAEQGGDAITIAWLK